MSHWNSMKLKPQVEPIVHSSLGLNALCERLQAADRSAILELGPVRGRNIEFWSRFSDSIYVADLPSSLPLTSLEEGQDFPGPEWDQLVAYSEDMMQKLAASSNARMSRPSVDPLS